MDLLCTFTNICYNNELTIDAVKHRIIIVLEVTYLWFLVV